MTLGTFVAGGFKEIDAVVQPGWYQFCPENDAFTGTGKFVSFTLFGAANMRQCNFTVALEPIDANLVKVDGTLLVDATLNLKKINVVNSAGDAIVATSSGSNGSGIKASGNGSGHGATFTGGTTGNGMYGLGGATSGHGASFAGQTSGHGVSAESAGSGSAGFYCVSTNNGPGFSTIGHGTGQGFIAIGGATGNGINGVGGATSGAGAYFNGTGNGAGMTCIGVSATSILAANGISGAFDAAVYTSIADALLKRDMSAVTGEANRSLLNCLRILRNKWSISGTTGTVTKEDDTTPAWTFAVTTDAAALPITSFDGS